MKFFKCHSQKMKDDKVICLQDKFTDIGPDVFDGFCVEYIVLADTTKAIRNYAFAGTGKCCIYLPKSITEIEPFAFENISSETVFYCVKGSYAEEVCLENKLTINYDTSEIHRLVEEQKKQFEEQRQLAEAQRKAAEEKRIKEEKEKAEKERLEKEKAEKERKAEEERKKEAERKAEEERKKKAAEELKKEAERKEKEAKEAELAKQEDEKKRKIKKFLYDDRNGEKIDSVNFDDLTEEEKTQIEDEALHIHCLYIDNAPRKYVITKSQYKALISSKRKAEEEKKSQTPAPEQKEAPAPKTPEKPKCPFCKGELLESDMFCPYCGRKVKNMKICGHCGEPNDVGDNFCSNCGSKM